MDATALNHYVKSVIWNMHSAHLGECLAKGVDITDQTPTQPGGWHRIGRYAAGKQSARVQASKLRKRWPNLMTSVISVEGEEWTAELWARVTTESDK